MVRPLLWSLAIVGMPAAVLAQSLPANVCETVRAMRGSGPITSTAQLADILNAAAWAHRVDGWGLSTKRTGERCRRSDGQEVACDILHHRPTNQLWDVFVAAGVGEPTHVTCTQLVGVATDPERPWLAPIAPLTPRDPAPDAKDQLIASLRAQLAAAEATLATQTDHIRHLEEERRDLERQVSDQANRLTQLEGERDALRRRVDALEQAPAPTCRAILRPRWVGRLGITARCEIVK